MSKREIYLRVDVDFNVGLGKGVPWLLALFDRYDIKATFYTVMGPDTLHRHSARVGQRSFRERLFRLNFWKILWHMGPAYLRSRCFDQQVAGSAPKTIRDIIDRGHELGAHGYDHAAWADRCYDFEEAETRREMELAFAAFNELVGDAPRTWGAPNWRCNPAMFQVLEEQQIPYSSDTRGTRPFYPRIGERVSNVLQLPISMPCLHELVQVGWDKRSIPDVVTRCLNDEYNLFCIHSYYEGLLERELFESLVSQLCAEGWQFRALKDAFESHRSTARAEDSIERVSVPGGARPVSCEKSFLEENYFDRVKAPTTARGES